MLIPQVMTMLTMMVSHPEGGDVGVLESDMIPTAAGALTITFIGHASLYFTFADKVVYSDPVSEYGDYSSIPKADLILITHDHYDHFDPETIATISTEKTRIVLTETCARKLGRGIVMKNGDTTMVKGIKIEAVPSYNILHMRTPGEPFHPRGIGNGYIATFGDKRVYLAGDTENISEMKSLGRIDIAFLPMNLPYTMTPEMVAEVARTIKPAILYPYHYGDTDTGRIVSLLKMDTEIEVRIRRMS